LRRRAAEGHTADEEGGRTYPPRKTPRSTRAPTRSSAS